MSDESLEKHLSNIFANASPYSDGPTLWLRPGEWSCDPESMCNTRFTTLFRVLYFMGDIALLRNFMKYLIGQDSFHLEGITYEAGSANIDSDFVVVFSDPATLEHYLNEMREYHLRMVETIEEHNLSDIMHKLAENFRRAYYGPYLFQVI